MRILAMVGVLWVLAACGGSNSGGTNTPPITMTPSDPMLPDVQAAVLTAQDYSDSLAMFDRVDDMNRSSPRNFPPGVGATATYAGIMDAQFPLPDNLSQHLVGDVELDITFDTRTLGNVAGRIDNLHIVNNGIPNEQLTGSVVMGGQYNFTGNDELNVNGRGDLTGTFGTDRVGTMNFGITLTGDMRGKDADQIIGITGRVRGNAYGDFGYPLFYSETSAGIQAGQFYLVREGATVPD